MKLLPYLSPPNSIQIELVEGCNLFCSWCGIRGIRKKPGNYKFISVELINKIIYDIKNSGWNSRIEFAMHGEPTLHPQIAKIIKKFHKELPKQNLTIFSNGGGLLKKTTEKIDSLFDSGLTTLALDDYKYAGIINFILKRYKGKIEITSFKENSPYQKNKDQKIIIVPDISNTDIINRKLSNHCGAAFPLDYTLMKSLCVKPFRELSIRWDGNIALCCNDFRGVFNCGSIKEKSIEQIWNNKKFDAARRLLFYKRRTFYPCYGCNSLSFRVGLLPDKMGKKKEFILPPDKKVYQIIKKANEQKSITKIIKREWEKDGNIYTNIRKI